MDIIISFVQNMVIGILIKNTVVQVLQKYSIKNFHAKLMKKSLVMLIVQSTRPLSPMKTISRQIHGADRVIQCWEMSNKLFSKFVLQII